jgi:hypothetical protein
MNSDFFFWDFLVPAIFIRVNAGGPLTAVAQALIGHDSEAIHQVYVSVGFEALKKAANTLPDLLEKP